ncbi:2-aminoethylphosphonate-pyruvate transaminase [Methylobacterium sp. PvP109]|uniref:2-aminoethylphosphonate-pyruvate transaminase n=1 Tax=Methylobacterium radiotolerans TaxID=31998 RepID=A0ABV2NT86_9HYPH|nr:2-aminoethylphosphonate-pyruvate transaminase [Methylobacterium sp. PvP105]MBP2505526.1 2-aminoethylphosphonate-pyruvate transaminase [Methylobacterium sp. PvP109]
MLILSNGAYGDRAASIAARLGISYDVLRVPETEMVDARLLEISYDAHPAADYIYVVHCETTTGIINPLPEIARFCKARNIKLIVDAIGTIGSETIDVEAEEICAVIGSSNKCIESSPGVAFVVVDASELECSGGNPFSVSLDLFEQCRSFESTGQWRFTPPTHSVLALQAALAELEAEGGISARRARHQDKRNRIYDGMRRLGFETYIPIERTGCLILTFKTPSWPLFTFRSLFEFLSARQIEIYPGKLSDADTFRIGCIGKTTYTDVDKLLSLVGDYLSDARRE